MVKKNLDSAPRSERGERAGCLWTETLRILLSSLTFVALFPVPLAAQATSPAPVYGTGFQPPLLFQGESVPVNQLFLSTGVSTLYDDNIFGSNYLRLRDEALSINSALGITRQTEHLTASFNYMPFFLLYRQFDQYDKLNHDAQLNLAYRLTSRVILGLHDIFGYREGAYPSLSEQQIMSGPGSPTALSQMIIPYTTRVLANAAGLDLTFVKSQRTSLTLSGGYNQLRYGSQTAGRLYNVNGLSGGLTFQYRVTEHTSLGVLLVHQDTTYKGGKIFGNRLRSQIESTFLSVGSRLSPTVTVTVFGGPQYVRTIGQASAAAGVAEHFYPSGGGSITREVRKTALDLSFRRSVIESGGLYTSVINTNVTFGVRRRLVGHWEAECHGRAVREDASLFQLANGRTDGLMGGIDIYRPFLHGSVFRISYNTMHQLSKGTLPISSDFDRNQVAAGIDYRFKAFRLGQ